MMRRSRFPWRGGLVGLALALLVVEVVRRAAHLDDDSAEILTFVLGFLGWAGGMAFELES